MSQVADCIAAIVDSDAEALYAAVEASPLEFGTAKRILRQAWRRDKSNDKAGDRMGDGGLVSAVYAATLGYQKQFMSPAEICKHDNATTLIAVVAAEDDDTGLLDVIIDWDPNFRMTLPGDVGSIDSTARFFLDLGASRCAARMLERKDEMAMALRDSFVANGARERVKRTARALLDSDREMHEILVGLLQDIEEAQEPITFEHKPGNVFTLGLSLMGKPEILGVSRVAQARMLRKKVHRLCTRVLAGDDAPPSGQQVVQMSALHPVQLLLDATSHLRAVGAQELAVVRV